MSQHVSYSLEEVESLQDEIALLKAKLTRSDSKLQERDEEVNGLQDEITLLKSKLTRSDSKLQERCERIVALENDLRLASEKEGASNRSEVETLKADNEGLQQTLQDPLDGSRSGYTRSRGSAQVGTQPRNRYLPSTSLPSGSGPRRKYIELTLAIPNSTGPRFENQHAETNSVGEPPFAAASRAEDVPKPEPIHELGEVIFRTQGRHTSIAKSSNNVPSPPSRGATLESRDMRNGLPSLPRNRKADGLDIDEEQ